MKHVQMNVSVGTRLNASQEHILTRFYNNRTLRLFHWGRVQTRSLLAFYTQIKRISDAFPGKKYLHAND